MHCIETIYNLHFFFLTYLNLVFGMKIKALRAEKESKLQFIKIFKKLIEYNVEHKIVNNFQM